MTDTCYDKVRNKSITYVVWLVVLRLVLQWRMNLNFRLFLLVFISHIHYLFWGGECSSYLFPLNPHNVIHPSGIIHPIISTPKSQNNINSSPRPYSRPYSSTHPDHLLTYQYWMTTVVVSHSKNSWRGLPPWNCDSHEFVVFNST